MTIPPLPAKINSLEELVRILDDRLRRIAEWIGPDDSEFNTNMGGSRLRNVGDPVAARDAVNLAYLTAALARARGASTVVADSSQSISVGVTGAGIEIVQVALGVDPNNLVVSGATAGLIVALFLEQDGTGGRTVVWPAGWKGVQNVQPSPTADTYSVFLLAFLSPTMARLMAQPIIGVPLS